MGWLGLVKEVTEGMESTEEFNTETRRHGERTEKNFKKNLKAA